MSENRIRLLARHGQLHTGADLPGRCCASILRGPGSTSTVAVPLGQRRTSDTAHGSWSQRLYLACVLLDPGFQPEPTARTGDASLAAFMAFLGHLHPKFVVNFKSIYLTTRAS